MWGVVLWSVLFLRFDINGWVFVYLEVGKLFYIVYFDEFGYIGFYLFFIDKSYKIYFVFGLGGVVLFYIEVRKFLIYFY